MDGVGGRMDVGVPLRVSLSERGDSKCEVGSIRRSDQVKRMIASVDRTGAGTIDFNEFLELLLAKMVSSPPQLFSAVITNLPSLDTL